jgi:putative oxidoreductase
MLTAIHRVHLKNGPWVTKGGYEYNLVLIAAVLAITETGPGKVSLDHVLGTERSGPSAALAALALGAAGAVAANRIVAAYPAPPEAPQAEEAPPSAEPAEAEPEPASASA